MAAIRKIDHLNRIVLPCDMRRILKVEKGTLVTLTSDPKIGRIYLKKATSSDCGQIVRSVDELGRICLSKEFLGWSNNVSVYITCDGETITLSVTEPVCRLCGEMLKTNGDLPVCDTCIAQIKAR